MVWGRKTDRKMEPIRVENAVPVIVDRKTYDKEQTTLNGRSIQIIHPRRVTSQYLLSGLLRCGHCGKALVGQEAKSGKFAYYVCGSLMKKGAGTCSCRYLNKDKFERIVVDKIKEHVLTEENLTNLLKLVNEEIELQSSGIKEGLVNVGYEINNVSNKLEKYYTALETGKLALEDLAPRIKELRARQEQLKEVEYSLSQALSDKKVDVTDMATVVSCVTGLHSILSESTFTDRKSFIRSFVKEIKVTGDLVTVNYTVPLLPQGKAEEELSVLGIERNGGRYRSIHRTKTFKLSFNL